MPAPLHGPVSITQLGPEYLAERPNLAALIAQIITRWSNTEMLLGSPLSRIFHTSPVAAMEMLLGIRNQRAQQNAIDAAAAAALTPEHAGLYTAIRRLAQGCESERNKFAHWPIGIIPTEPDALVLVDPADMVRLGASFYAWLQDARAQVKPGHGIRRLDRSRILVYREKELIDLVARIDRVRSHVVILNLMLDPGDSSADRLCAELKATPDIAVELAVIAKNRVRP